jgi:hypothetical protein
MSRAGVEAKLPWRFVPSAVRQDVREAMGSPVTQGKRVWGGYGPTPTFRLLLADGRRVFFKGINRASNEFARRAIAREERVYRDLSGTIGPWAPRFYAAFQRDDWHVLLLEDVGPKSVPPWTPATTRRIAHAYAAFHEATLDSHELPDWLPRPRESLPRVTWRRVAAESQDLRSVAALATGHSDAARDWLQAALPLLCRHADTAADLPGPYALLHGDTRSDNLRFTGGRLALFDWPSAEVGRPELDVVAFAQSITVEGGVDPEQVVAWYGERLALRPDALDAAVAWLAAFFADLAWRPDIPGLPRLRTFQRQQLSVVLAWAARRLRLQQPEWVPAIQ